MNAEHFGRASSARLRRQVVTAAVWLSPIPIAMVACTTMLGDDFVVTTNNATTSQGGSTNSTSSSVATGGASTGGEAAGGASGGTATGGAGGVSNELSCRDLGGAASGLNPWPETHPVGSGIEG